MARDSVISLIKATSIIKCFNRNALELGVADVSKKLKIPSSTAHRLMKTLFDCGLLDQAGKKGKYSIGRELYVQGNLYLDSTDITKAAGPVIKSLNELTGEATTVSIFDSGYITMVMREESTYGFRWAAHIGSIQPAYAAAMGKALLSELTEAELDSIYPEERLRPVTKKTITNKLELKLELEHVRETGVAFCREELFEGINGIASVIRDAKGNAAAALSIGVPIFRMSPAYREQLATLVKLGSSLISHRLGYQDKFCPVHDIDEIRNWWGKTKGSKSERLKV